MLAGAEIVFWLFLWIAGPWGAYLILTEKIKPWYWARRGADDFRKKFNFYVLGLVVICLIYSGLYYFLGAVQLLLATVMWALVFSAAYFSVWLLKKLMIKARVELRLLGLGFVGVLLILLVVTIFKDLIFVDMSRSTIRKELQLSAEMPKHEIFYREYNRFYFTAQTPFELKLVGPDEQEFFKFLIAAGDHYPAYEFDKTGTLILSLDRKMSAGGLVVYTIERGFSWKRFALRNYPLYRYLTLYLFFWWVLLYFSPQKMLLRKDEDMTSIEIDKIALLADFKMTLSRGQDNQNMLVAWFRNLNQRYGHKVDMNNLIMQIEDIELRTKAIRAFHIYYDEFMALQTGIKAEGHIDIKEQIAQKRLEQELIALERQIEQDKAAIRDLQVSKEKAEKKEPAKSEFEEKLEFYKRETTLQIQAMISVKDRQMAAREICDQIRRERKRDGEEIAEGLMRTWYEMGLLS